jgi:hypothetical protein
LEDSTKKRINHKDFQLSSALNKKKKIWCVIKLVALCDVNENYSCATAKKLFEHCLAANYENVR